MLGDALLPLFREPRWRVVRPRAPSRREPRLHVPFAPEARFPSCEGAGTVVVQRRSEVAVHVVAPNVLFEVRSQIVVAVPQPSELSADLGSGDRRFC